MIKKLFLFSVLLFPFLANCATEIPKPLGRLATKEQVNREDKPSGNPKRLFNRYLERQKQSSVLDPKDCLLEQACRFFEKASKTSFTLGVTPSNSLYSFAFSGTTEEKGIGFLEQAIEINPHYHAAHYVLGVSYRRRKDYAKAEQHYLKCVELKPMHKESYKSLGALYKTMKKYDDSLEYYNRYITMFSPDAWVYLSIGDIYWERNELGKAEDFYSKSLELQPGFRIAHEKLMSLYLSKGDLKKSYDNLKEIPTLKFHLADQLLKEYRQHMVENPYYGNLAIGTIHLRLFEYAKARWCFKEALKFRPNESEPYRQIGYTLYLKAKYLDAIEYWEKALKIEPIDYQLNIDLGRVYGLYITKPNYERSIELLKRGIWINPDKAEPHNLLGLVHYYNNQYHDALEEYELALQLHEDAFTRISVAKTLAKLEQYDRATSVIEEGIEKHGENDWAKTRLIFTLGEIHKEEGDCVTAIKHYEDVLKLEPKDSQAYFQIGECYFKLKNWDEAENWWKKDIHINPRSAASFYNIGLVYVKREQFKEGMIYFRKALDIDPENKKAKDWIGRCQLLVDNQAFSEKLKSFSYRQDKVGLLAKLYLCKREYDAAKHLWVEGVKETKRENGQYNVSPKIYIAQGRFEKIRADLRNIKSNDTTLREIMILFFFSCQRRIEGIMLHSESYNKKRDRGEHEKSLAKMKLADAYFVDALKILLGQIENDKLHFGRVAEENLKIDISHYEEIK